jgi:broad specificity phosphatase PhoE
MNVIIARHDESDWSKSRQHTGLTEEEVSKGKNLGKRLVNKRRR